MQEKANIQTSTLRVPKNILEEIKIYCRKAGKPVGEWVETAWKFIEKNDFDIYDKETTPFLPVPPDIEKERNQVEALCITTQKLIGRGAPHGKGVYQHSRRVQPFAVQISVRFYLDIRYKIPNFDSVTKSNKTDLWKRNQEKRPGKVEPEKVPEERLCPACTPRP